VLALPPRFVRRALAAKRDKQTDESKKDKVQRPKDKERCVGFGNKVDKLTAPLLNKMKGRNEEKYDETFKVIHADFFRYNMRCTYGSNMINDIDKRYRNLYYCVTIHSCR